MKLSLTIPEPLLVAVELFNSIEGERLTNVYCVEPATREQVKRAMALDVHPDEVDALKLEAARAGQVAILTERSGRVIAEEPLEVDWKEKLPHNQLTGEQAAQLCRGLLHFHLGQDPVQAEAIHQAKKKAVLLSRLLQCAQSGGSDSTGIPSPSQSISEPASAMPEQSAT